MHPILQYANLCICLFGTHVLDRLPNCSRLHLHVQVIVCRSRLLTRGLLTSFYRCFYIIGHWFLFKYNIKNIIQYVTFDHV